MSLEQEWLLFDYIYPITKEMQFQYGWTESKNIFYFNKSIDKHKKLWCFHEATYKQTIALLAIMIENKVLFCKISNQ